MFKEEQKTSNTIMSEDGRQGAVRDECNRKCGKKIKARSGDKFCTRFSQCCRRQQDEGKTHHNGKINTAGHASVQYPSGEDLVNAKVVAAIQDEDNS